jgi:Phage integrase family
VDLANRRLFVGRSKTKAGLREIKMLPVLRDVLAAHKAQAPRTGSEHLVFPTETGGRRDKDNLRNRVLLKVFDRANELLEERGQVPLPKGLTPHRLRHTFASVLVACGEDPTSVMHQLGHTDPAFTLRVYAHLMSREPGERARLKALVKGDRVVAVPPPGAAVRVLEGAARFAPPSSPKWRACSASWTARRCRAENPAGRLASTRRVRTCASRATSAQTRREEYGSWPKPALNGGAGNRRGGVGGRSSPSSTFRAVAIARPPTSRAALRS